jgi:hypothetical protein
MAITLNSGILSDKVEELRTLRNTLKGETRHGI